MNTDSESSGSSTPAKPPQADFSEVAGADTSPKDEALAAMEKALDAEKDARLEERFLWILVCVVLIDVIWFANSPNPTYPVVILVLQIIGLVILARRMGVEEPTLLLERVLMGIGQRGQGGN